jgi:hypothetical protein
VEDGHHDRPGAQQDHARQHPADELDRQRGRLHATCVAFTRQGGHAAHDGRREQGAEDDQATDPGDRDDKQGA